MKDSMKIVCYSVATVAYIATGYLLGYKFGDTIGNMIVKNMVK